jgi:hypothetical protein
MYCELTNENKNGKFYSIQGIPEAILPMLTSMLEQVNYTEFGQLYAAVASKAGSIMGVRFFDKAWTEIELCKRCDAVGFHKNEHPVLHSEFTIEPCAACNGEGSRVKKVFVQYEPIDENKRKRFAGNGF